MKEMMLSLPRPAATDAPSLVRIRRQAMAALTVVFVVVILVIGVVAAVSAQPRLIVG